jgi:hypothetical protein
MKGELSSWILQMYGFRESKFEGGGSLESRYGESAMLAAAQLVNRGFGPGVDVREEERRMAEGRKIANKKVPGILVALRTGDLDAVHSEFSKLMSGILDAAEVPHELYESMDLSHDGLIKQIRSTRALVLSMALLNEHPIVVMKRAANGDRRAVLDLVKIDSLFLHDSCCNAVIRHAELQEDEKFLDQLRRAVGYQCRLHSRDVKRVYYYILFTIEASGVSLPTLKELWSTVDPLGRDYDSLFAFERAFQRQRLVFDRMVESAAAEIPFRWATSTGPGFE